MPQFERRRRGFPCRARAPGSVAALTAVHRVAGQVLAARGAARLTGGQVAQSVPLALQVPLVHCIVAAAHAPFALHIAGSVSTPPVHDCPAPHGVPTPLLVVSVQTIVPVVHDVTPFLHGLVGWQA